MAKIPEKIKQIAIVHAQLINSVVACCQNKQLMPMLEPELKKAENNGWIELVKRIRKILTGNRKTKLLIGLDEEDAGIILSILVGLQNPQELPKLNQIDKAKYAPDAIAKLIKSYQNGDGQEKQLVENVIEQMKNSEGDMQIMSDIINKLIHKNFDISDLTHKMTSDGKKLIERVLEKL